MQTSSLLELQNQTLWRNCVVKVWTRLVVGHTRWQTHLATRNRSQSVGMRRCQAALYLLDHARLYAFNLVHLRGVFALCILLSIFVNAVLEYRWRLQVLGLFKSVVFIFVATIFSVLVFWNVPQVLTLGVEVFLFVNIGKQTRSGLVASNLTNRLTYRKNRNSSRLLLLFLLITGYFLWVGITTRSIWFHLRGPSI